MYVEMFHLQKNMVFFTVITISIYMYINYNYEALFFYYPYLNSLFVMKLDILKI